MNNRNAVIITNYNQGHLIKQAITSVFTQSVPIDELIVVDDASTDDSAAKIKEILKACPKTIKTRLLPLITNVGQCGARNAGVQNSTADVIGFLDADDYYYSEKMEKSAKILRSDEKVGIVYSDYETEYTLSGEVAREYKYSFDLQYLVQSCIVSTNSVYSREVFKKVGLLNQEYRWAGDYEFYLRAVLGGQFFIEHIPEALFRYRLHGDNITMTTPEKVIEEVKLFKSRMFRNG